MKLSEAIRLGAMLNPQAFGNFTDGVGTCAIGAAHLAVGLPMREDVDFPREWDVVLEFEGGCPECGLTVFDTTDDLNIPAHLNDTHRWTRERIADWADCVERIHGLSEPAPVVAAVRA
jgi:hypothetical protein